MTEEIVNYVHANPVEINKKHVEDICKVVKITAPHSEIIAKELQAPVDNYLMMEIEAELVNPMSKMMEMSSILEECKSLKRVGGDHEMLENSDLPSTSPTNSSSIGSMAELCERENGIATSQAQRQVQEFEVKQTSASHCRMEDIAPSSDLIEKQEYTKEGIQKNDGSLSIVDVSSADLMDEETSVTNGGPENNLSVANHENNFTSLHDARSIQIPETSANYEREAEQVFDGQPVNPISAPEDSLVEDKHEEDASLDVDPTEHVSSSIVQRKDNVMDIDHSPPKPVPNVSRRKKLLIIDINGLLADIVSPAPPREYRADIYIARRAVFKRPFYKEFLHFCLERFDVAVWSSRTEKNVERVTNYLLGDMKQNMLFCWDVSHCTPTGVKTLENKHKDLVCKELKRVWEKDDPGIPWAKGDYDESNTLLLDDSPYKALLNPPHSAIFPHSFQYHHRRDTSLGPGGDIRVYLEELYAAEDVQNYVETHPFGQSAINERDASWEFYNKILSAPQLPLILDPSIQPGNEVTQIEGKTTVEPKNRVINQNEGQTAVQTLDRVILKRGVDREHIIVIYDPAWYV